MIGIVSVYGDLHTHVVAAHLESDFGIDCSFFDTSSIQPFDKVKVEFSDNGSIAKLPDIFGNLVPLNELVICWYRRMTHPKLPENSGLPTEQRDLVSKEFVTVMQGAFDVGFNGKWISDPHASRIASNKVLQLSTARAVGLRVPDTIISNDKSSIREFVSRHSGNVIAKPNYGLKDKYIFVGKLDTKNMDSLDKFGIPAIFQESITGIRHLRVNFFGYNYLAYEITAPELDWRSCLRHCSIKKTRLDSHLEGRLVALLDRLNLKMGIFDLKIDMYGDVVFFEVNTQGQFLFLDAFFDGNENLNAFCSFLAGLTR